MSVISCSVHMSENTLSVSLPLSDKSTFTGTTILEDFGQQNPEDVITSIILQSIRCSFWIKSSLTSTRSCASISPTTHNRCLWSNQDVIQFSSLYPFSFWPTMSSSTPPIAWEHYRLANISIDVTLFPRITYWKSEKSKAGIVSMAP